MSWFLERLLPQVTKLNTVAARVSVKTFCFYPGEVRVGDEGLAWLKVL